MRPRMPRPVLDVAALPTTVFGSRAPLWWGVVGMIAIESTMFALMTATYFYLRGGASVWPPPRDLPRTPIATVNMALLIVSVWPMHRVAVAAARRSLRGMRRWLLVATAFGLACLVLRVFEFSTLSFRWDTHVYGSLVWTILGLHSLHLLASNGENVVFLALLFKGPVQEAHLLDLRVNALYWYFVVLAWLPLYAMIYLDPGIFKAMGGM